ncbi:MAG TPA: ABC transporter permease subunit [Candidatus Saccharimonadales bacterium]|nr:ABC transporter permease subunit [Candidatus Saccharimonadales bacterium]
MIPIIKWTLWQRRWSRLWWCIGIISLIVLTLALYPTIRDQAAQLNKSFGGFSQSTLALFGGTDFFSPIGYLNSQIIYFTLPLILSILAIGLGSNLIGREETDTTLEALLARPISRSRLLVAKALAGIFEVFFITFIASAVIVGLAKLVNLGIPLGSIIAACLACLLLVLTFGAVAFLLSATGRGRAAALGIAVVYAFGGYIIGSLSGTVHWLKSPSLIFPYHYYRTADILHGIFSWSSVVFFVAFTFGCGVLAWLSFRQRDLQSR